ncbi:hypothetical protein SS50377_24734 [Spironucleus salmonicida]|uniref:Uncharacterized protein n=1 Tax=Spironucleus salmonicida TaxID=348837 RepID=V6LJ25_9EUKA|nr:hypothetical protein SS50377_24734 [Spironucleus salmonicida]|eukprot:EST44615.1 Hypothetical protein SS50377_15620 [Spironucleus salmonicida]
MLGSFNAIAHELYLGPSASSDSEISISDLMPLTPDLGCSVPSNQRPQGVCVAAMSSHCALYGILAQLHARRKVQVPTTLMEQLGRRTANAVALAAQEQKLVLWVTGLESGARGVVLDALKLAPGLSQTWVAKLRALR